MPVIIGVNILFNKKSVKEDLTFYCAAGLRLPIEDIVKDYENEYGIKINIQFGGSGTLLANLEASAKGDLYLAADSSYTNLASEKGLVIETIPICELKAGLVVKKGNPLKLRSLKDCLDSDSARIALANPEAASVGKLTKNVLTQLNLWDPLSKKSLVMKPTVNEVANSIKVDAADVGIIWDVIASQYDELDFVNLEEFNSKTRTVTLGLLESSNNKPNAMKFARYLSSIDKGQKALSKYGYKIIEGDEWEDKPNVVLFTGAMLNPAIKQSMEKFEEREGVKISVVPNGCGILVSQMKAGARPDAYFSCDLSFMDDVQEMFSSPVTVSQNDMIILVNKKASDRISKIDDLTKPGIRVGLAHPEKSALGALTVNLLNSLEIKLGDNLELNSATGDFLVNKLRAGSLDAGIVYKSNALANPTTLDDCVIVEINSPLATALQPFAIGLESNQKNLMERLFKSFTSEMARSDFEKIGFKWMIK